MTDDPPKPKNALKAATSAAETDQRIRRDTEDFERFAQPAVYVESFSTQYWKNLIRLSFAEGSKKRGRHWRFTALMEADDARGLIRLLERVLKDMDSEDSEENPETESEDKA